MKNLATVVLLTACLLVPGYAFAEGKPCCSNASCKCTQQECMSGKCTCAADCCKDGCKAGCCKDGKCPMKADGSKGCGCGMHSMK